jgi:hypothetical protein
MVATNTPTAYVAFNLPPGLSCGAAGLISGTPTTVGTFPAILVAVNGSGAGTATLTVTVTSTPPASTSTITLSGNDPAGTYQLTPQGSLLMFPPGVPAEVVDFIWKLYSVKPGQPKPAPPVGKPSPTIDPAPPPKLDPFTASIVSAWQADGSPSVEVGQSLFAEMANAVADPGKVKFAAQVVGLESAAGRQFAGSTRLWPVIAAELQANPAAAFSDTNRSLYGASYQKIAAALGGCR